MALMPSLSCATYVPGTRMIQFPVPQIVMTQTSIIMCVLQIPHRSSAENQEGNLDTQSATYLTSCHGASHSGASFVPEPGFVLCPQESATQFPTILFPNKLLIATTILRDLISQILCLNLLKGLLPQNVL